MRKTLTQALLAASCAILARGTFAAHVEGGGVMQIASRVSMWSGARTSKPVTWVDGQWYNRLDGSVLRDANYSRIDDFLPVIGGHNVTWRWSDKSLAYCYILFYDANKEYHSGWYYSPNSSTGQRTVTAISNAAFARFSVDINYKMGAFLRDETTGLYIMKDGKILV